MSKANERRSVCPVACTLDLIGDKWTLLVVRDLFAGKSTYTEFAQSPERIATNILAERLTRLTDGGLVERTVTDGHGGRHHYRLTERGRSLWPVLHAVADWGLRNVPGTAARVLAVPGGEVVKGPARPPSA
jgi:DNA-binding HxlR family transcriptional regulator